MAFPNTNEQKIEGSESPSDKGFYHFFTGAITYHFFDFKENAQKFKHNIGDQGKLISHPFFGVEKAKAKQNEYTSNSFFVFHDSLASLSIGAQKGRFINLSDNFEVGYFWGVYFIRQSLWERNAIDLPIRLKLGRSLAAVPILGLRQSLKIKVTEENFLILSLGITPNTATTVLGFTVPY